MAFATTTKRMFTYAWLSFTRNAWLSAASILVLMMTLFVIGGLLLLSVVTNTVLSDVEEKFDISVAFKRATPEQSILVVKRQVEGLDTVSQVMYVSPEEALTEFRERHKNDEAILASLEELGDENPLAARLDIKANRPQDLPAVAEFLNAQNYSSVEKINYFENQRVYDRLSGAIGGIRTTGVAVVLVLAFVAVLIAFTTVRLAIYSAREEINIMRLVGATNWYIRSPFMITGLMHGVIAAVVTGILFFPIVWFASPRLQNFVPGINLQIYFGMHFVEFIGILLLVGILLGVGSSVIATRRYLRS
jgi:cell division transport system permease protein